MSTQRGTIVAGYVLAETLGEGTFGKVKLGQLTDSDQQVAVKILDIGKFKTIDVKKERATHKICSGHPNVVKYIDLKLTPSYSYLVLELAAGGELFDRIIPDKGVSSDVAHFYFRQLFNAVEFCHSKGVTHRDVKPENILLDSYGNVKLTDFGFATCFRYKGTERKLDKKCGTPPYVAPEVYAEQKYDGNLIDYWSCGVVLVALLTGGLPWNKPTLDDDDYRVWASGEHPNDHWYRMVRRSPANAYDFLWSVMHPVEKERLREDAIKTAEWFVQDTELTRAMGSDGMIRRRVDKLMVREEPMELNELTQVSTQDPSATDEDSQRKRRRLDGSRDDLDAVPARRPKVRRETCFTSRLNVQETMDSIAAALDILGLTGQYLVHEQKHTIVVTTTDARSDPLVFSAKVFPRGRGKQLVDFRMNQGDGLEFRRRYGDVTDILFNKDTFGACTQTQFQTQM